MGREARRGALSATQLAFSLEMPSALRPCQGKNGVVYTRPWVVELTLDTAGYLPSEHLASRLAIEPAAGQGAFLLPMIHRLIASCKNHQYPLAALTSSLLAYELDAASATATRAAVVATLLELGLPPEEAHHLSATWVRTGDYLRAAPLLPEADFIIGNPPYIRQEEIDDDAMAIYRSMYRTMQGRADLYIAFFEAALRGLKANGACAFICADRWMTNQYGAGLCGLITQHFSVETLLTMHSADAFDQSVSAYPALTVMRRAHQGVVIRGTLESFADGQQAIAPLLNTLRLGPAEASTFPGLQIRRVETWASGENPWPCADGERLRLLRRLEDQFSPLESEDTGTRVGIGVATGLDDVFITTDTTLVEPSRLLPLALTTDIATGQLQWSEHYLVNPWDGAGLVGLEDFPRLQAYLTEHVERLKQRHTARQHPPHWYRTIDRVNSTLLNKPKLYIADIKEQLSPVLDQGHTYPHHNLYVVQSDQWDLEVLGGLLLSAVGQFFVECYGTRMRGGYLRFQAQYLRRIRVPRPQDLSPAQAASLIQAFRQRNIPLATRTALALYKLQELPGVTPTEPHPP